MGVYYETAYPMYGLLADPMHLHLTSNSFPLFDRNNTDERLARLEQASSSSFFCSIMAACALASARVRDRAAVSRGNQTHELLTIPAETFYVAAEDVLPSDLLQTQDFGFLRGCALLAIASIQDAKINAMHKHIGIYFTILAIHQWHDEANWPANLSQVEREELRRLVGQFFP